MADSTAGWKFGADVKGADGHLTARTCYVAVADREAAREALAAATPDIVFHPGPGQAVSASEWTAAFGTMPEPGEVRCDG